MVGVSNELSQRNSMQTNNPVVTTLPPLKEVFNNPVAFAEINEDALTVLWEEATIAACEVDSPNSPGWDEIQENKFDALVDKFWCRFILQYSKMARENKIGEKCDATQV